MSPEGTGREDGGDDERVDPALADAVESAFDGVVLDESGNPVAPAGAAGEAGGSEKAEKAGEAEAAGSPESESSEPSELERARAEAAQAADDLARARADLYNLQQEYQGFVRRTGTFETTAGKLETVLADKFGLVRFGEAGETFDPTIHEALMATESDEVDEPSIAMVLQPGYRLGERIVRAARVQVANPA